MIIINVKDINTTDSSFLFDRFSDQNKWGMLTVMLFYMFREVRK